MKPKPTKVPKIAKAPILPPRSLFTAAPRRPKMKRGADPKVDAPRVPAPATKRGGR
jgi:hypothetical protein